MMTCNRCKKDDAASIETWVKRFADRMNVAIFLDQMHADFLCESCVHHYEELYMIAHNSDHPKWQDDFYQEGSFVVFTEQSHVRRGYCCMSKCKHCPYGYSTGLNP